MMRVSKKEIVKSDEHTEKKGDKTTENRLSSPMRARKKAQEEK